MKLDLFFAAKRGIRMLGDRMSRMGAAPVKRDLHSGRSSACVMRVGIESSSGRTR